MSNQSSEPNDAQVVFDALVDGLRPKNRELNGKCARALRALGSRVLPMLSAVTRDPRTKLAHRRRIVEVCVLIDEGQAIDRSAGRLLVEALLAAFVIDNPQHHSRAVAALKRLPRSVVDQMILAAHDVGRSPKIRVRILDAVGDLNMAPSVNQFLDLMALTSARHPEISKAAWRLIWRLRSGGNFAGSKCD